MRRIAAPKPDRVYGPTQVGQACSASGIIRICYLACDGRRIKTLRFLRGSGSKKVEFGHIEEHVSTISASNDGRSLALSSTDT
jgi:hypothetical protein